MKTIVEYNLIKDDMDAIGELANWPWPNRIDPTSKILPKVTNYDMSERNQESVAHLSSLLSMLIRHFSLSSCRLPENSVRIKQ